MILSRIFSTGHLTQTAAPLRIPSICLKQQATGRRKMSASPLTPASPHRARWPNWKRSTTLSSRNCSKKQSPFKHCINAICTAFKAVLFSCPKLCKRCFMFCITYDTTCYADPQRAFDFFMRQLWESFGPVLRVRKNKRIVSHPQPHRVGKYHAPHLRPDPHPHLPRDRLQGYHSEPEIPPEGSCSRADEAQDDSDTDNTDEGDHLCLTG
nr:MAG TPA: hypothetical protein [Caudoviricetes sp.]DAT76706.1 MAG TPA: hypothetical protein [Caudoviricetes sp.]DAU35460.1 MAG TPA: hypothetical protein [Caudoviricetes sp.]